MNSQIPDDQKALYLSTALAMAGLVADLTIAGRIIKVYEGLSKKGGDFSLQDAIAIKMECETSDLPTPPAQ